MAIAAAVAARRMTMSPSISFRSVKTRRVLADSEYEGDAQRYVDHVLNSDRYVAAIGILSLFNLAIIVIDTDARAACMGEDDCAPEYIQILDYILLLVYTIDLSLALFAQRCLFFRTGLNWIDFAIVVFGIIELVLQVFVSDPKGLSAIGVLKITRISRVSKVLRSLPELYKLVSGFMHTLKALTWGFVMILLLLLVWAIIILQAYMILNAYSTFSEEDDQNCIPSMTSSFSLVLMLWQTNIIGDNWGRCFVPLIAEHWTLYWIFAIAFICINLGFTNLILAVIVEKANAQHDETVILKTLEKSKREEAEIERFRVVFQKLDKDGSNGLSIDEFLDGFEEFSDFKNGLLKFGIDKCDLNYIFACLDSDGSGEVGYDEFINAMFKSKRQDTGTQLMLVQMTLQKMLFMMQDMQHDVEQLKGANGNGNSLSSVKAIKRISLFTSSGTETAAPPETLPKEAESQEEPLEIQSFDRSRSTRDQSLPSEPSKELDRPQRLHLQDLEHRLGHVAAVLREQGEALEREMQDLADMVSVKELCMPPKAANGIPHTATEASGDPLQTIVHPPQSSLETAAPSAVCAKETDGAVVNGDIILDEAEHLCAVMPGCTYLVKPTPTPEPGPSESKLVL